LQFRSFHTPRPKTSGQNIGNNLIIITQVRCAGGAFRFSVAKSVWGYAQNWSAGRLMQRLEGETMNLEGYQWIWD
jgi:hypothetical protein